MFKAHRRGVYLIPSRVQSQLWPYVNTQKIIICCVLSSVCFEAYLYEKEKKKKSCVNRRPKKSFYLSLHFHEGIKKRENMLDYLKKIYIFLVTCFVWAKICLIWVISNKSPFLARFFMVYKLSKAKINAVWQKAALRWHVFQWYSWRMQSRMFQNVKPYQGATASRLFFRVTRFHPTKGEQCR